MLEVAYYITIECRGIIYSFKHTHIMINKKLIEQARKDRDRSLMHGSIFIMLSGLALMVIALFGIMDLDNPDVIPSHILFMFGAIVACFGIFTGPGEK
jgi:hypothetical protein